MGSEQQMKMATRKYMECNDHHEKKVNAYQKIITHGC